jgi:hypothetical protein
MSGSQLTVPIPTPTHKGTADFNSTCRMTVCVDAEYRGGNFGRLRNNHTKATAAKLPHVVRSETVHVT